MQKESVRGLIWVEDCIFTRKEQAKTEGFSYAWHDEKLHCDLYSKTLDDEGHKHSFVRVIDIEKEISLCFKFMGLVPEDVLFREIKFRCSDLVVEDIWLNIKACVQYVLLNGLQALLDEDDDCNIWDLS